MVPTVVILRCYLPGAMDVDALVEALFTVITDADFTDRVGREMPPAVPASESTCIPEARE